MIRQPRGALRSTSSTIDDGDEVRGWMRDHLDRTRNRQEWTVLRQAQITAIAAPTGNESLRARAVQQAMRACGASSCDIDAVGNVCAEIRPPAAARLPRDPGSVAGPLVCLAHLDAVYGAPVRPGEPVTVRRDGPLFHGAGIGDNGRGLAALLLLATLLHDPDVNGRLRRPVHLVATVGEEGEGNLRGARAWFDDAAARGITPCAAIAIDGPGDDSIVHHAVGSHRLRVALHGAGGHSWVHAADANPIHVLGAFIGRAARLGDPHRRDAVVHVTRMHGGESVNALPQHAWVDVELRGTSATRIDAVRRDLVQLATRLTPPSLRAEIIDLGMRPAGTLHAEHPLVRAAVRATEAVGRAPRSAMASTDANIPLARGIPAIAIGAGGTGGGAHTSAEWYDDTHGARGLERLAHLVLHLATR